MPIRFIFVISLSKLKGHPRKISWFERSFFNEFLKSRKLYIYLVNPFRWPWRRLRKKAFYFFLLLRETRSKELKYWNFSYIYVTYVVQHLAATLLQAFLPSLQEAGSLIYVTILGDWCAKMAPSFLRVFLKSKTFSWMSFKN